MGEQWQCGALTGVDADAALRAADEEAGSIFLQVGGGRLLLTLRVFLSGGGEAHLWDQRFAAHPAASVPDWIVHAAHPLSLAATHRKTPIFTLESGSNLTVVEQLWGLSEGRKSF